MQIHTSVNLRRVTTGGGTCKQSPCPLLGQALGTPPPPINTELMRPSVSAKNTCGATRNLKFPGTRPDGIETSPGLGNIFKNFFGLVGSKNFKLGRLGQGIFTGV